MNRFVLMPCREWPVPAVQHNLPASPCLVVLVIIATRRGRDQIWPISCRTYRLGSLGTSAEVLRIKIPGTFHSFSVGSLLRYWGRTCNLRRPPSGGGSPKHPHSPHIARNGSGDSTDHITTPRPKQMLVVPLKKNNVIPVQQQQTSSPEPCYKTKQKKMKTHGEITYAIAY